MNDTKPMNLGRIAPDPANDGIARIGGAMTRMRLLMGRRVIGRLALSNVAPDLELSHLDVLEVVRRIGQTGEATVGAIAETMRVDPSRGSRMVAELVQRGVLRRDVSQADGRRAVVELTARGRSLFEEIHAVKTGIIAKITADWEPDDVTRFGRLFETFITAFEQASRLPEKDNDTGT
ncbi:MAG: MarR family winged helix-turn-helix transcriptional regulator [Allorhizobium sp.]